MNNTEKPRAEATESVTLTEARNNLAHIAEKACYQGTVTVIRRNTRPLCMVVPLEYLADDNPQP
jgi:PHD/YefM family antitoxin component YafN of YafNO toxin-antitoxin module